MRPGTSFWCKFAVKRKAKGSDAGVKRDAEAYEHKLISIDRARYGFEEIQDAGKNSGSRYWAVKGLAWRKRGMQK